MELISIGILIGGIVATISFAVGVICESERSNTRQHNTDSDIRLYIPVRDRSRSSSERSDKPVDKEEMRMVLEYFRIGATSKEKKVLDAVIDRIGEEE